MQDKVYKYIKIIIILISLSFMLIFSYRHEFGVDELDWTLFFLDGNSFIQMLKELARYGYNLPLYYIILFPFYKIAPFNKFVLMIPSITFTILGLLFVYKTTKELYNKEAGFLAIIVSLSSYYFYNNVAWGVRPYGLLFGLSSISYYYFIKKYREMSNSNLIKYYISLTLLIFTHWFGCIIAFIYGIVDLFFLFKKRIKFRNIIWYAISIFFILIWILFVFKTHINDLSKYWPESPNIFSVISILIVYLNLNLWMAFILFIFAKKYKKNAYSISDKIAISTFALGIIIIITVAVYSSIINPKSSLWVERYFICYLPQFSVSLGYIIYRLLNVLNRRIENIFYQIFINSFIYLFIIIEVFTIIISSYQHPNIVLEIEYKKVIDFLKDKDIQNEKTVVVNTYGQFWVDYYYKSGLYEMPRNIICINPHKVGNTNHDPGSITEFNYVIKDGKECNDECTLEDFLEYDKIYFTEIYRFIEDAKLESMFGNYNFNIVDEYNTIEMTKETRNVKEIN